jgi:4'-phosphopantetheinyl transferase
LPDEHRQQRVVAYWTLKESYIKARGRGLAIALKQFGFPYPHERAIRLLIQPDPGDEPSGWCFWQFRPFPGCLLAVCVERHAGEALKLTLRKAIPTVMAELLDVRALRGSEFPPI